MLILIDTHQCLFKALIPVRDTWGVQTCREEWFQPLQTRGKVSGWDGTMPLGQTPVLGAAGAAVAAAAAASA